MAINERLGKAQEAKTCNQLAEVAKNTGRLSEAERWYLRAIDLSEKLDNKSELCQWTSSLAAFYLDQNQLDKAEVYASRALAILETLDIGFKKWITYSTLAEIAENAGA